MNAKSIIPIINEPLKPCIKWLLRTQQMTNEQPWVRYEFALWHLLVLLFFSFLFISIFPLLYKWPILIVWRIFCVIVFDVVGSCVWYVFYWTKSNVARAKYTRNSHVVHNVMNAGPLVRITSWQSSKMVKGYYFILFVVVVFFFSFTKYNTLWFFFMISCFVRHA